jgi:dynactin 1
LRQVQNKDLEVSRHEAETRLADFSDEVELATLDKEMAEERLDQSESALVTIKDELETVKVELASLQEIQGMWGWLKHSALSLPYETKLSCNSL